MINSKSYSTNLSLQIFQHFSLSESLNYIVNFVAMIGALLPYCYFGTSIVHKFKESSQRAYDSLWYNMPLKYQMELKFLLHYTQTERHIKAYNFIECSLGTFLYVSKKSIYLWKYWVFCFYCSRFEWRIHSIWW